MEPPQALPGSGSADKEGRAELVGRARGKVGRAGRAEAPPRGQAGEGGRGRRGREPRWHHVSGRGGAAGRALGALRELLQRWRRVGPAAAAGRTARRLSAVSSPRCPQVPPPGRRQRRREEPAGGSAMGPLRETKVRRARLAGADGGVRERRRERSGVHCGEGSQVRAGGVTFRVVVNGDKEVVGTMRRQGTVAQVMRPGRWGGDTVFGGLTRGLKRLTLNG